MEKVTLTKLYETLAQKIGRNEAECLTNYVDIKVKDELNAKTEILATKASVKDEVHSLRLSVKEDIHGMRNEMKDHSLTMQKWLLSILLTVIIMILGLYGTMLFKH